MRAMILCAGQGTRLRPLTDTIPKPLLPVAGKPLLFRQLEWLVSHGIREVAINLHYLGHLIEQELGDGSPLGVKVMYSHEDQLLGTAGAVKKVESYFDGTFAVVYGDVLTNFDLSAMLEFHRARGGLGTICLHTVPNPSECGIVCTDERGKVHRFVEKPPPSEVFGNLANGGVYILERRVLEYIPGGQFFDFGLHLFPLLVAAGEELYGYPLCLGEYLIDIGTPEKYRQAQGYFLEQSDAVGGCGTGL